MEYIGTLIATCLISGMYLWFYERLNIKYNALKEETQKLKELLKEKEKKEVKEEKPEITEEQKKEFERVKKAFNNLMGYDEKTALKKKE